jgi:hypothetical protein
VSRPAEAFLEALGGLPFVNRDFRADLLVSAVACARRRFDPEAHPVLVDYLDPENARVLFRKHGRSQTEELATVAFEEAELDQLRKASELVLELRPEWAPLFALPVHFRKLADGRMSVTSALIPQVIYLGKLAFRSEDELAEVLVHEHAHLWLNFIAEVSDLQTPDAIRSFRLPSGTSGKSARGVLLAAHFAAAALAFHVRRPAGVSRAMTLLTYLQECLEVLESTSDLSEMGRGVASRLEWHARNMADWMRQNGWWSK